MAATTLALQENARLQYGKHTFECSCYGCFWYWLYRNRNTIKYKFFTFLPPNVRSFVRSFVVCEFTQSLFSSLHKESILIFHTHSYSNCYTFLAFVLNNVPSPSSSRSRSVFITRKPWGFTQFWRRPFGRSRQFHSHIVVCVIFVCVNVFGWHQQTIWTDSDHFNTQNVRPKIVIIK